jgi:NAD+ synthase
MIRDIEGMSWVIQRYLQGFTDIAVVGLSGGADSTLVAILCKLALGKENVVGVHMPYDAHDSATFNALSHALALHLEIEEIDFPIFSMCRDIARILDEADSPRNDKLMGNVRARIRMTCLYAVAEALAIETKKRVRVIGTDNMSENMLGYFTKYGDGGVDLNPVGLLYKSEVYQFLDYFKSTGVIIEEHINRVPSAGLWQGQTDEGELGYTYAEIEKSLRKFGKGLDDTMHEPLSLCDRFVTDMMVKTQHKREIPMEIPNLREFCD